MRTFNRTYLPEEVKFRGKEYIKDRSIDIISEHTLTKRHVIVEVLSINLQNKIDLHGRPYKPSKHAFIEVKSTLDRIITPVSGRYGAPMGRIGKGLKPTDGARVFDCYVPMIDGAYDKGGAYWGLGSPLRVSYTKDLKYVEFYRVKIIEN